MTKRTTKQCPECLVEHDRARANFCCPEHQKAFNNRAVKQGVALVPLLKAWAMGRGGGHTTAHPLAREAMRELTRMAKDYNEADKRTVNERGEPTPRMNAIAYAELLMANGSLYFDRKR